MFGMDLEDYNNLLHGVSASAEASLDDTKYLVRNYRKKTVP